MTKTHGKAGLKALTSAVGKLIAGFLTPLLLAACGGGPTFRIDGTVDGLGTQNLTLVYYADGAVQQVYAPAVDSKFSMMGNTDKPALVWVYNNTGTLVGRLIVEGGDAVEARFSLSNPYETTVKGNDDAELLARFIRDNAALLNRVDAKASTSTARHRAGTSTATKADREALNRAVETFVKKNRKSVAAAAVLAEFYDYGDGNQQKALELLDLIDPDYRPDSFTRPMLSLAAATQYPDSLLTARHSPLRDGMRVFGRDNRADTLTVKGRGRTLLMFTTDDTRRSDSVSGLVESLADRPSVKVADLSMDKDTTVWHRSLPDAGQTDISRYWLPGGPAAPVANSLHISADPYFVIADSTARILYRGASVSQARRIAGAR